MTFIRFISIFFMALVLSVAAHALDLQGAKTQGVVGEKADGYIGAVSSSAEASTVVQSINSQRKQAYQAISRENGQPLNVVEKLAAQKLYEKLQPGEYYQAADGSWKKK